MEYEQEKSCDEMFLISASINKPCEVILEGWLAFCAKEARCKSAGGMSTVKRLLASACGGQVQL